MQRWRAVWLPATLRGLPTRAFDPVAASILFQLAFLVSAVLGIARQVLFNAQFGTGTEASAYVAAFRLPETLLNLIGGGTLSSAIIPVLLRAAHADGPAAEQRLVNLVLTAIGLVATGAAALGMVFAGPFVRVVLAPGFDAPTSALTITLARVMLLQPPLIVVTTVAIAVLNSRSQFFLTALSLAFHNVALIGGIQATHMVPALGIYGPLLGLLCDGMLQAAILLPGLRVNQFRFRPIWDVGDRRLREVARLLVPSGLSAIVNYSGTIVDTAAASFVAQSGTLPAINSAFLLVGLPTRLFGQAIGQSVFPRIAAHAAANEWPALRRVLGHALVVAVGLALPAAAALLALGRWTIRLLFEHGQFSVAAGDLTYVALAIYALGLPFTVATELLAKGLTALYDTRTPLLTNVLQVAGRIGLIALLLAPLGAAAIPLAFVATSAVETCILGVVLWARLRAP